MISATWHPNSNLPTPIPLAPPGRGQSPLSHLPHTNPTFIRRVFCRLSRSNVRFPNSSGQIGFKTRGWRVFLVEPCVQCGFSKLEVVVMQKALLAASWTNLFGHLGGRYSGGAAAAASVKLQNEASRIAWRGNMVTKAGEQVEQAGDNPKVEVSSSDEEENETRMHPHTRKAYRDDMEESYGVGYATRASEMGYGERYGEAVKAVLDKKADKRQMQRGATSDRDQRADAFVDVDYDTTQGEPVAQKEVGRNSQASDAFQSARALHKEEIVHEEKIIHEEKTIHKENIMSE